MGAQQNVAKRSRLERGEARSENTASKRAEAGRLRQLHEDARKSARMEARERAALEGASSR